MQTYHSLATDSSQDSIRRSCVDGAVALVGILSPEEIRQHVLQLLQSATEDKSALPLYFATTKRVLEQGEGFYTLLLPDDVCHTCLRAHL